MSRIKSKQISDISTTITNTINITSINALSDVDTATTTPTNGQVLSWNGTNWVPANSGSGSSEGRISNTIINSGFPYTIVSPASTVTTLKYLIDNGSAAVVVNLPTAANPNTDLRIEIKRRGTANVTVTPNGAQLIDGLSSVVLSSQYATLVIDSDGTGWNIK